MTSNHDPSTGAAPSNGATPPSYDICRQDAVRFTLSVVILLEEAGFNPQRIDEEADDIIQESWLRLLEREAADPVKNVSGYLFRTAKNLIKDLRRKADARARVRRSHRPEIMDQNPRSILPQDEDANDPSEP